MLTRLARWWLARKVRDVKITVVRAEECERCGALVSGDALHTIVSISDDDRELGIDGSTAVSADFCAEHCPGGCRRGCAKIEA